MDNRGVKLIPYELTQKEKNLIELLRKLPFGQTQLTIFNEENQPIRIVVKEMKKSIKL